MRELFQQVREEIHALRLEMNEVRAELQNLTVKFLTRRDQTVLQGGEFGEEGDEPEGDGAAPAAGAQVGVKFLC